MFSCQDSRSYVIISIDTDMAWESPESQSLFYLLNIKSNLATKNVFVLKNYALYTGFLGNS